MYKTILGIETSCDETAAAVLKRDAKGIKVLSNIIASSAPLQSKFGGVIPEQAAREQLKAIIPVIQTAIHDSPALSAGRRFTIHEIDAIAVTQGPGLIGSLLVGVETAKTLSLVWNKPLIPVNHLIGHFYANWIDQFSVVGSQLPEKSLPVLSESVSETEKPTRFARALARRETEKPGSENRKQKTGNRIPSFPIIGLLVSGGHTDLVLFTAHNNYEYLGGTRDDAAGECFDKCARLLGLPYPGGPEISLLAKKGDPKAFNLPRPMMKDFSARGGPAFSWDFSFSGLKTSVSNIVHRISEAHPDKRLTINDKQNLSASIQETIVAVLIKKTVAAAKKYGVSQIMIAGGVAANQALSEGLRRHFHGRVFSPSHNIFCTDNAAMIAAAGFFANKTVNPLNLQADPNLSLR